MPAKREKIAMRAVVSLLAALLVPLLVTQALAQAEPQEQEPPAREAGEPYVITFPSPLPVTNYEVGMRPAPSIEAEPISLVQLEGTTLFPTNDAAESDSPATTAPAAASISTTAWVVIVVAAAAVAFVLIVVEPG